MPPRAGFTALNERTNRQPVCPGMNEPAAFIPALRRELATPALAAMVGSLLLLTPTRAAEVDIRRDAVVEVVEKVMPCVVNIGTETVVEVRDPFEQMFKDFFGAYSRGRGLGRQYSQYSLGSGVIIDEDGYVLTNLHVVRRASRVWVKLQDGRELEAEPLVGTGVTDVALLRIKGKPGEKFKAVQLARDDDLLLGETVIALGNPFGLGGTVTRGILSSKDRRAPREGEALDVSNWLQTDAPINPGSSGGPLINLRGELIGLNVAVYREAQGIGFAIPVKRISEVLSEFFTPEAMEKLWCGVQVKAGTYPLQVKQVQPGSPADKAGLRAGDAILQINEQTPRNIVQFNRLLTTNATGRNEVQMQLQRGSERKTVSFRLEREKDVFKAELIQEKLGVTLEELSQDVAERLGLNEGGGFIVAGVEKDGPAAKSGLQRGYLVQGIDGYIPRDMVEAAKLVFAHKKGEKVQLAVLVQDRRGAFVRWLQRATEVTVR
jgi:S1-C subfamily serine protease